MCEVIWYRLVQVRQYLKTKRLFGLTVRNRRTRLSLREIGSKTHTFWFEWVSMDFAAAICELERRSNRFPSTIGCFGICLSRPGRRLCMLIRFSRVCSSCTFHSRCIYSIWPFYWTVYGNRHYFFQTMYTVTVTISNLLELRAAQRDKTPCTAPKLDFWTSWREYKIRNWLFLNKFYWYIHTSMIEKHEKTPRRSNPVADPKTIRISGIQKKSSSPTEHDPNEVLLSYWTRSN